MDLTELRDDPSSKALQPISSVKICMDCGQVDRNCYCIDKQPPLKYLPLPREENDGKVRDGYISLPGIPSADELADAIKEGVECKEDNPADEKDEDEWTDEDGLTAALLVLKDVESLLEDMILDCRVKMPKALMDRFMDAQLNVYDFLDEFGMAEGTRD